MAGEDESKDLQEGEDSYYRRLVSEEGGFGSNTNSGFNSQESTDVDSRDAITSFGNDEDEYTNQFGDDEADDDENSNGDNEDFDNDAEDFDGDDDDYDDEYGYDDYDDEDEDEEDEEDDEDEDENNEDDDEGGEGGGKGKKGKKDKNQKGKLALWATVLKFNHPVTKQRLTYKVSPPSDQTPWKQFNIDKYL